MEKKDKEIWDDRSQAEGEVKAWYVKSTMEK